MPNYVKIDGSSNLIRDMKTHAIINTDEKELERNLSARQKKKQQQEDIDNLKKQVSRMENLLEQILEKISK